VKVFLDFEASSLGKKGVPIEVAWVFEDGQSASYLICPAPGWDDWDAEAEAIHHIDRATLARDGTAHDAVAAAMIEQLTGHDLLASAPSWDGKWLSALLRGAGFPRHTLRLRDSDDAHYECARKILEGVVPAERLEETIETLLTLTEVRAPGRTPAHRALADAREEQQRFRAVGEAARELAADHAHGRA
jgi:hypothetical protein